jgi:N6-adenosine-specific RNA methylase IME4
MEHDHHGAGRVGVLQLDPPWPEHGGGRSKRGADAHYPLMRVWEIAALDIPSLLLPDAHVWIWTTSSYTDETYRLVLPSWGLTPVFDVPWVKCVGRESARRFRVEPWDEDLEHQVPGLGQYTRKIHETLILAKRGRPPLPDKQHDGQGLPSSVLFAPRGRHSAKPVEALELMSRVSDQVAGDRLCIFAPDAPEDQADLLIRGWRLAGLGRDGRPLAGGVPMPEQRPGWQERLRRAQRAFNRELESMQRSLL